MTRAADRLIGRGRKRAALNIVMGSALLALVLVPQQAQAQFFWDQPRFSPDDAARVALQHGFRVLARPLRNDDVYVVQVIDRRGAREQLIIASDTGEILQRAYLGGPRRYRAPMDPSIPPGPIPPERIPEEHDHPGFFARLFGGDDNEARPPEADLGPINRPGLEPLPMPRQRPARRRPQVVEQAPETIHQTPVESAPLAPPSAAPSLPPRLAPPRPAMIPHRPPEASLPPPAAAPEPAPKPAPTPTPAPDRPTRSISRDPLAIPGSREQDEKAAPKAVKAEPAPPAKAPEPAAPAKPPVPKNPVAVAPLE